MNILNYLLRNFQRRQIETFIDSKNFFFFHQKVGAAWYFTPFFNFKHRTKKRQGCLCYWRIFTICVQFIKLLKYVFFLHFLTIFFSASELLLFLQSILGMTFFAATGSPLLFVYFRPDWCFLLLTFPPVLLMGRFLPWPRLLQHCQQDILWKLLVLLEFFLQ